VRFLREIPQASTGVKRGDVFTVTTFATGEKVAVVGTSKGRGFQGVVKRHGFAGGPASHGHKDNLRMPGSIGAGGVQRVFKDMRMGGHMGDEQITVKNLEVIVVKPEVNELWIKGAIPGARNGLVLISTAHGEITIERSLTDAPAPVAVKEETPVEPVEETTVAATEPVAEPVAEVTN
jgi:large subunit ribosomal protein L3